MQFHLILLPIDNILNLKCICALNCGCETCRKREESHRQPGLSLRGCAHSGGASDWCSAGRGSCRSEILFCIIRKYNPEVRVPHATIKHLVSLLASKSTLDETCFTFSVLILGANKIIESECWSRTRSVRSKYLEVQG